MKKKLRFLLAVVLLIPGWLLAIGQAGNMLTFDGIDDAGVIVDNALLDVAVGNYTLEAWFNSTAYTNNDVILDCNGVFILRLGPDNTVKFLLPLTPELSSPNNTVTPGWHHVAVRVAEVGADVIGTLFFDGLPVAVLNHPNLLLPASIEPITVGNRVSFDRPFTGALDEIRIWNIARTDAEIKINRGLPLTGTEIGLVAYHKLDEGMDQVFQDATINDNDGVLGSDPILADINDPAWAVSTAPIGFNLLTPNSGTLLAGDPLAVTWAVNPEIVAVAILFSFDGGINWFKLTADAPNTGSYATMVPGYATSSLRYRIANPADEMVYDDSDDDIEIDLTGYVFSSIRKEGEDAAISSHMYVGIDGRAFGCQFIYSARDVSSDPGIGTLDFDITSPGIYVIWARALGAGSTRNSWLVKVDGGPEYLWDTTKGYAWTWDRISHRGVTGVPNILAELDPIFFHLAAGHHTIQFRGKEHYTRLDRIVITNDLATDLHGSLPIETIHITAPPEENHAEIVRNTPYEIQWVSSNIGNKVTIEFQKHDTDPNWILIVKDTPNDGSYIWTAPDELLDKAHIRISEGNGDCPVDQTWETVHIINPPPEILVTAPNGGEIFAYGEKTQITWTSKSYIGKVDILFSLDNGKAWTGLAANLPQTGLYEWVIPKVDSDSCLVKVIDRTSGTPSDVSDQVFSIVTPDTSAPAENYALYFDGIDDFLEVANHPTLNVADHFTIEFWIKTDNPTQSWTRVLEKGSWDEYYIGFHNKPGKIHGGLRTLAVNGTSSMTIPLGPSLTALQDDQWYHVAATYDLHSQEAVIYINGVPEVKKKAVSSPRSLLGDLIVGAVKRPFGKEFYYEAHLDAILDELRIWNIARTEADIIGAMYTGLTGVETGLMAYYPFNEGSGQIAHDLTSNGNHGRLGMTTVGTGDSADPLWVKVVRPASPRTLLAQQGAAYQASDNPDFTGSLPEEFKLYPNFPNPFNAGTTFSYDVPNTFNDPIAVRLEIYDLQGRMIRMLINGAIQPGQHRVVWDGADSGGQPVSSGIYFYRLQAGDFVQTNRMIMLK
ncbi:MAG TPA: T9SS type A sorting domain-containing protein [bacterium]|nr:T9SS type A sorting domain-containing protein [bacterium]HPG46256.1 T9SS type A sorting domain-containing protein [bacterium]HPM98550.1 T9SS type A sorting domain-containing protein [bacterium]